MHRNTATYRVTAEWPKRLTRVRRRIAEVSQREATPENARYLRRLRALAVAIRNRLVLRSMVRLRRLVRRRERSAARRGDLFHSVMLAVIQFLDRYDGSPGSPFWAVLSRAALFAIVDDFRIQQRQRLPIVSAAELDGGMESEHIEALRSRAVRQSAERCCAAIEGAARSRIRQYFGLDGEQRSFRQIASRDGSHESAIRRQLPESLRRMSFAPGAQGLPVEPFDA